MPPPLLHALSLELCLRQFPREGKESAMSDEMELSVIWVFRALSLQVIKAQFKLDDTDKSPALVLVEFQSL
jgi:hypothetical protein